MTEILRGPMIRFVGDPFRDGDEALVFESDGALAWRDGVIVDAGPADRVLAAHPEVAPRVVVDRMIAPGFVDCHVHYPQIGVIASYGAQLLDWLTKYTFPEEARFGDPAHAADAARAFFDETLRHGVATTCAFCTIHPASVDAYFAEAQARGLRALGGKVMMDRNAPEDLRDDAQTGYDDSLALANRWGGVDRLGYVVTPRFAPTSTEAQLEAAGALTRALPNALMQTHLSENHAEIAWVSELFPSARDYLDVYDRFGLVGPRSLFGHGIHLTPRERARLAEADAVVTHCPTSNAFLGSGACDVDGLIADEVRVGLATDTGGGTSFSMFDTMKAAYELSMSRGVSLSAAKLWSLATTRASGALRLQDRCGNLAAGLDADFILLDPAATPLLSRRLGRAESIHEALFAYIVLGDDRAVAETWSGGRRVHMRGAASG